MNLDARPRWLPSARVVSRYAARPEYRERATEPFPDELRAAVLERAKLADARPDPDRTSPVSSGNVLCRQLRTDLDRIPWELLDSDAALKDHAEKMARRCAWSVNACPESPRAPDGFVGPIDPIGARILALRSIAEGQGINPPGPKCSRLGEIARFICPLWWRRRLRRTWHARAEETMRTFGLVHKGRAAYVTEWTRRRRRRMRRAMYDALRSATITSDDGTQLELFDLWKGSISNPAVRRAELMVRLKGFEVIAAERGDVARFYTLTAPSAFHPFTTVNGKPEPNPRYEDKTADQARRWLLKMWARIRAKLKRLSILVYGFRIAEPHHDGTPHLHILLWMPPASADQVATVLRGYVLSEYADEPGAAQYRFDCTEIDPAKGSAVGYVAKYIAKNVDGHKVGDDHEAEQEAKTGSRRAEAWATVYSIRQFQQIGGPTVGLWRNARTLRNPVASEPIERVRSCADAGDYAGFIRALGGIVGCRGAPVRCKSETSGVVTRYGEVAPPQIIGIQGPDAFVRTRLREWRIRWGALSRGSPWTRGNNCTRPDTAAGDPKCAQSSNESRKRSRTGPTRGSRQRKTGTASAPGA